MNLEIDFTLYQKDLKLRQTPKGKTEVFDMVRRKYVPLQPEELVRQLLLHYLIFDRNYPLSKIRVEMGLTVNELSKRCDILIFDKEIRPIVLVECKAATIKLGQNTFEQIARYNLPLKVPQLIVTNGLSTFCCEMSADTEGWVFKSEIPRYDQ